MLTAQQARELVGRSVQEKVESLLVAVKEIAKMKGRCLPTNIMYQHDPDLWVSGGYARTEEWKEATKILEDLGYQVDFFYEDMNDMYTKIKW